MQILEIYQAESDQPEWSMVTDRVMGGCSTGDMHIASDGVHLHGQVSYENNGGFVQVKWPLKDSNISFADYDGVWFVAKAPQSTVATVVLKSSQLWMPWQSYRAQVELTDQWQQFAISFTQFKPYKTWTRLKPNRLSQFALLLGQQGEQALSIQKFGLFANE